MTPTKLKEIYDLMNTHYSKPKKRMRLLDATDKGELWSALNAKMPSYQILPDTNYVSYVKNNILASIYTVTKKADLLPTSEQDKQIVMDLNLALDQVWDLNNIGYYQFQAGERAALMNVGYTQVGWDEGFSRGSQDSFIKGTLVLKNLQPERFMRDPWAPDLDTSAYCCYPEQFHKSYFLENKLYKEKFKEYYQKNGDAQTQQLQTITGAAPKSGAKDYFTLTIYWIKDDAGEVHEVHTINNEEILYKKENLRPKGYFPIAELFCNLPAGSITGTSEPQKIFANNVAINLLDSLALTAEYKNQRPPKFISDSSGLNLNAFNKHANDADHTFIVRGDPSKAVQYQQFPQLSPATPSIKMGLEKGIEQATGVDGRYTGRDTGSIITTGGTEEMLNRVTLIDTPKILNYERYTKRLTQLIIHNLIEFAPKRKYFYKKPNTTKWGTVEVDFPSVSTDTLFNYAINISSELPKNKARVAAMANMLIEKQMQYASEGGAGVDFITPEEWLMFQDLPFKEFLLERMGLQRAQNAAEDVSQILFGYANLVNQGMTPDDAMLAMADMLEKKRKGAVQPEGSVPAVMDPGMMGQAQMANQMSPAPMPGAPGGMMSGEPAF